MSNNHELNGIKQSIIDKLTLNIGFRIRKDRVASTYRDMDRLAVMIAKREADVQLRVFNAVQQFKSQMPATASERRELNNEDFDYLEYYTQRKEYHVNQMFRILEAARESGGEDEAIQRTEKQTSGAYRN